jgi:hypothetical protein
MTGSCESFGPRSTDNTDRPRNSSSVKPSCCCTAGLASTISPVRASATNRPSWACSMIAR